MLLEQVKSLNLPLFQSLPLLVAMVLRAAGATCAKPPATTLHYRTRAAAFVLSQFVSLPPPDSSALEKPCHGFLSVPPSFLRFSPRSTTRLLMLAPVTTTDIS